MTGLRHNAWIDYADAATGDLVATQSFYDPYMRWEPDGVGGWRLRMGYGCGRPMEWWLEINPCPE